MTGTVYCPNCGQPIEPERRMCPHCGREQPPMPVLTGEKPREQLLTRSAGLDVTLGVVTTVLSLLFAFVGVFAPLVLYFVLRGSYPAYARGLGYGLLVTLALFLGLLALCIGVVSLG